MSKLLVIDRENCIGCGTCVVLADKTFKMADDGKAVVITPPGDEETKIQEAIDSCPVSVIKWTESQ